MSSSRQGARKRYAAATGSADRSRSPPGPGAPAEGAEESQDLRRFVGRLLLSNKLSGLATQQLSLLGTKAKATGIADLGKAGNSGRATGNIHRDLMRSLKKGIQVPSPYWAEILTRDPKTNQNKVPIQMPFLLVHEMLGMVIEGGSASLQTLAHLEEPFASLRSDFCRSAKLDSTHMVGIGFHGDGVPHQRGKSVYVFSWNPIAAQTCERILFSSIQRDFLCQCGCMGRCTLDGIAEVFRWCMCVLVSGAHPTCRHDRSDWLKSDRSRQKKN